MRLDGVPRFSELERHCASLFDGVRNADARWAEAQRQWPEQGLSREWLEGLAARLAAAGRLRAGRLEPLPVPPNRFAETQGAGWTLIEPSPRPDLLLPSTVPGSRAMPGLPGGLIGARVGMGTRSSIDFPLPSAVFYGLGRLFVWPQHGRLGLLTLLALLLLAALGLFGRRLEWWEALYAAIGGGVLLASLIVSAIMISAVSQAARAASVLHETGRAPRCGLTWGRPPVPHFWVDTQGAPEQASRAARMRMVGATLTGSLTLLVFTAITWLLFVDSAPRLAMFLPVLMATTTLSLLLRANPLIRFDGHAVLAQWLGQPDLRHQSFIALAGAARALPHQAGGFTPGQLRAYAWFTLAFFVLVITLMVNVTLPRVIAYGDGLGFLAVLAASGVYMYKQLGESASPRSGLGWQSGFDRLKAWRPSTRQKWIGGGVLLLCLIPYRYEPSGDVEILPQARADLRALVAGDIREVLVAEGDRVDAGQVIARIANQSQRSRVAASEATLSQLAAELSLLEKGARDEEVEVARSRLATVTKRAEFSRASEQRLARAYRQGGVSVQEYERARSAAEVDEQQRQEAERVLTLLTSEALEDRIAVLQAQIARERALLEAHRADLDHTEMRSPIAGQVVSDQLQFGRGRYLELGEVLAVIEDAGVRLAEIRLPEAAVGEIAVGRPARARVWAYPGTSFRGEVRSIAPVAEEGSYGQVVRVQVALVDEHDRLKSGMTGVGKVRGEWHPTIVVFTRALARFLLVEVWSWLP